jgi:hypothetical protein
MQQSPPRAFRRARRPAKSSDEPTQQPAAEAAAQRRHVTPLRPATQPMDTST